MLWLPVRALTSSAVWHTIPGKQPSMLSRVGCGVVSWRRVRRMVNREYHKWHSPALGREMELLVFGHAGARVLVFPTSMGRFYQWEDFGMVGALSGALEAGHFQLICVDTVDGESWYADAIPPA